MMKPQDLAFFVILAILIWRRNARLAAGIGLVALIMAIPLFATWTFFTAERLTWYAAAFFFLSIILQLLQIKNKKL